MIRGLIFGVDNIFTIIYILIISRCLLSWIPNLDWNVQPWKFIRFSADLYLDLFRRFIPSVGMIDISPIVAFFALSIIHSVVRFVLFQFL